MIYLGVRYILLPLTSFLHPQERVNIYFVEIDSFENIITLVEKGQGIALLPTWLKNRLNIKPYTQDFVNIPFFQYEKKV